MRNVCRTVHNYLLLHRLKRLWGFDVSTSLTMFASTCKTGALRVEGMTLPDQSGINAQVWSVVFLLVDVDNPAR